jgi:alpha-D-xyloside xylohydrolase
MLLWGGLSAFGLGNLHPLQGWEEVASGVWKVKTGEADKELTYTRLAARAPRFDALNALPDVPFPFTESPVEFLRSEDRMIQIRIPVGADESIYGFGLQLDGIKQNGKVLDLNVDHWSKGGGRTHAPVPFYISSRGYGVLFNTARFLKVHVQVGNRKDSPNNPAPVDRNPPPEEPAKGPWMALPTSDAIEAHLSAKGLEMIVFSGENLQDVVARYNLYCGGGTLPPLWGLGFWHRTMSDYTDVQAAAEVDAFADHQMPLDVLGLEPGWMTRSYPCTFEWQPHRFPDPERFARELLEKGIRLNLWENPYVSPEGKLYQQLYPYAGSHLVWLGIVPDYTMPEAQAILCQQHAEDHLAIGVSGYKVDEVDGYDRWLWPEHALFPSGTPAESMRQAYGLMMQSMLYKNLFHANHIRTWSLVRSSNAGASGLPFVLYSDSYSHSQYLTGISAASLGGILWTPEVRQAASAEEWRARIQTVCFSPLAMLNAWASGAKPWEYPSVTDDVREAIRLRMRLLPYLYTAFANYNRHGVPPMRAMVLEQGASAAIASATAATPDGATNPHAETVALEQNDQFMFGPSILVAPYYENQTLKRTVSLPKGNWYDFYNGEMVGNGTTIEVKTPERIPLFVKEGAVIPMLTKPIDNSRDAYGHPLEVRHYGRESGSFELYEDDGKTFDYETGEFALRRFAFAEGKGSESVNQHGVKLFGEVERWVEMTR